MESFWLPDRRNNPGNLVEVSKRGRIYPYCPLTVKISKIRPKTTESVLHLNGGKSLRKSDRSCQEASQVAMDLGDSQVKHHNFSDCIGHSIRYIIE